MLNDAGLVCVCVCAPGRENPYESFSSSRPAHAFLSAATRQCKSRFRSHPVASTKCRVIFFYYWPDFVFPARPTSTGNRCSAPDPVSPGRTRNSISTGTKHIVGPASISIAIIGTGWREARRLRGDNADARARYRRLRGRGLKNESSLRQ